MLVLQAFALALNGCLRDLPGAGLDCTERNFYSS